MCNEDLGHEDKILLFYSVVFFYHFTSFQAWILVTYGAHGLYNRLVAILYTDVDVESWHTVPSSFDNGLLFKLNTGVDVSNIQVRFLFTGLKNHFPDHGDGEILIKFSDKWEDSSLERKKFSSENESRPSIRTSVQHS